MALPAAEVVHDVPGRTRVRITERRGDRAYFAEARRALEACPSVRRVSGSPLTASVLIIHGGELASVAEFARAQGIFDLGAAPLTETFAAVAAEVRGLEARLRTQTRNKWGTASITFYGLIGAGLWQLARGRILPPTVTLLFQALAVYERALKAEQELRSRRTDK